MRQIILNNIRSAHNVGSIFRSAEGAGVKKIYLTGYTPAPIDRFGRKRKDISKVALGSEDLVLWERYEDVKALLRDLKKEEKHIVAVEQSENSIDYREFKESGSVVYIFGNEVEGVDKDILEIVDEVVEIPMRGEKESLNVAVSAGIILFQN